MKRILSSLFVIMALLGVGAFATGAYFQTVQSQGGFALTGATAGLTVYPEGAFPTSPMLVGPTLSADVCVKIRNDGQVPLNLSQTLTYTGDMALGDNVTLGIAVGSTVATCANAAGTPYKLSEYYNSAQPLDGTLAVGGEIWVLESLRWFETGGDQSALMGKTISLTGTLIGRTP